MTRTALFNTMLLVLLTCAAIAGLLWWYVQRAEAQLVNLRSNLEARQTELANLNQMTEAQMRLDALTLDERTTTLLELLKHLGLEKKDISFEVTAREERTVGDAMLITRGVSIEINQSYPEQMAFIEQLYGNGKLQLKQIRLYRVNEAGVADPVGLKLEGSLYSIEKKGPILSAEAKGIPHAAAEEMNGPEVGTVSLDTPPLVVSESSTLPVPAEGEN